MPSIVICAIWCSSLSLYRTCGEASDDAALEYQDHDDDRNRHYDRCRCDRSDRLLELRRPGEEREGGRNRPRVVGRRQRVGEDEVVPGEDEDEDRGGEHAGRRQ